MSEIMQTFKFGGLIALRHFRVFRRDFFANISPTIVEPFLYVVVFGYWLGYQFQVAGEQTYLKFMAPGIAAMSALFSAFFDGSYGFYVRLELELVFKALLTTPIGPVDILVGELLWLGGKSAIMCTLVSLVLWCMGAVEGDYLIFVPCIGALTGISCGCIGLISSCYIRNINQFQIVYAWIISPMFFMSGMFVPYHVMPPVIQKICWLSPFFHSVQIIQATLWARDLEAAWLVHGSFLFVLTSLLILWAARLIVPRLRR